MHAYTYLLILGSNLDDRLRQMDQAKNLLAREAGKIQAISQVYETQPWGYEDQPWFLNQALALSTDKEPLELLALCKDIEKRCGRQPAEKWHARHLDIDLLLCGSMVFQSEGLVLPHPFLQDRNFVLIPLLEIASDILHPVLGKTIEELYLECRDIGEVYIFNADE